MHFREADRALDFPLADDSHWFVPAVHACSVSLCAKSSFREESLNGPRLIDWVDVICDALCHAVQMTGDCAVFFLWSACKAGGFTLGSVAEWATFAVALAALGAAIVAGRAAHAQSAAATATLRLDIVARQQAQARLVYSTQGNPEELRMPRSFTEKQLEQPDFAWDLEALSELTLTPVLGQRKLVRLLERHAVLANVTVHNDSAEMISRVYLYFENTQSRESADPHFPARSAEIAIARALEPGGKAKGKVMLPLAPGEDWPTDHTAAEIISGWVQVIEFRDASGNWWLRREAEPIRRVRRHPDELPRRSALPTPLYPHTDIEAFTL